MVAVIKNQLDQVVMVEFKVLDKLKVMEVIKNQLDQVVMVEFKVLDK